MVSGRLYQATIALLLVLSVSVVGAAVTYSRGHGALRVQRAVFQDEGALPAPGTQAEADRAVPNDPLPANTVPGESVTPEESGALERQLRSYRVRLAVDGTLSGQVSVYDPVSGGVMSMNDVRVMFLQNGMVKARTTPASDGIFKVALDPGVYALVASGPRGYAAYGLQAIKADTAVVHTAAFQEITDSLQINTLAIPSRDFDIAKRLARSYIPRELLEKGNDAGGTLGEQTEAPPLDVAPETSLNSHSVSVRDGVLLGRMRRLHPQTGKPIKIRRLNAFLVQNNSVLATAPVSEAGFFKFKNVDPGVYSFVAAGSDGLAAFSFQAINSNVASNDTPTELTLVSFADGEGASGSTTGPENAGAAANSIGDGDGDDEGTGGAGDGGAGDGGAGGEGGGTGGGAGGGAGGGVGGGDGLLGALVGLGIGAGIGAAIADDDDDNNKPSTPDM